MYFLYQRNGKSIAYAHEYVARCTFKFLISSVSLLQVKTQDLEDAEFQIQRRK